MLKRNSVFTYRVRMGWTQAELAEKIGVTQSTVAQWEKGKTLPTGSKLAKVADVLGITVDELLCHRR